MKKANGIWRNSAKEEKRHLTSHVLSTNSKTTCGNKIDGPQAEITTSWSCKLLKTCFLSTGFIFYSLYIGDHCLVLCDIDLFQPQRPEAVLMQLHWLPTENCAVWVTTAKCWSNLMTERSTYKHFLHTVKQVVCFSMFLHYSYSTIQLSLH